MTLLLCMPVHWRCQAPTLSYTHFTLHSGSPLALQGGKLRQGAVWALLLLHPAWFSVGR